MTTEDLSKLKLNKDAASFGVKRSRPRRVLIAAAVAAALLALALLRAGSSLEVDVATAALVYPSQSFTLLNASGYVVAQRKAAVAAKTTGRLDWIGVEEGNPVRKNQVIARLENQDVTAGRDQAEANVSSATADLDDARRNFERMSSLREKGFVAQAELDVAATRLKRSEAAQTAAEAALRSAQVAVEYTLIRAPFDAVVLTKDVDVGDIVTPLGAAANAKAAVVTIADMSSLQVEVDVSESNLGKVRVGLPCEIQLDAIPDRRFRGVVHMIVPTADRTKASVLVKVRFQERDARVLPEMSARVAFLERRVAPGEERPRIAVPPAALAERAGATVLFVAAGGRAEARKVTRGEVLGDLVEITEGLKPGESVVLAPPKNLKPGAKIARREGK